MQQICSQIDQKPEKTPGIATHNNENI